MSEGQAEILRDLDADEAFQAAVERIIGRVPAGAGADERFADGAPFGPDQVPISLRGKVNFPRPGQGRIYQRARWEGGLLSGDDEDEMRRWTLFQSFMNAMELLLAAIKSDPLRASPVALPPARPLNSELPAVLNGRLELGETSLTWTGTARYLDQETDAALRSLDGDEAFIISRDALLAIILRRRPFAMGEIPESTVPAIPDALGGKLGVNSSPLDAGGLAIRLTWLGPSDPNQEERGQLERLAGPANNKTAFQQIVTRLLLSIDTPITFSASSVPMTAVDRRPRPGDLDPDLAGSIKLEPRSVAWDGVRPSVTQRQKLDELATQGDDPFKTGMVALSAAIDALLAEPVEADISAAALHVRPSQDELPGELQQQLLIGRAMMYYHGIMTADEARDYLEHPFFASEANRRALRRLYAASLRGGVENSRLWIKTRRGTASPGPQNPVDIADL